MPVWRRLAATYLTPGAVIVDAQIPRFLDSFPHSLIPSFIPLFPYSPIPPFLLYHFQQIPLWKRGELLRRKCLVPERHRSDIILKRQVTPVAAPTKRLNRYAQIR